MLAVRNGSKGKAVLDCQRRLVARGYGPLKFDGIFGPNTRRAVVQFQQAHALRADGVVGPRTWSALLSSPEVSTKAAIKEARAAIADNLEEITGTISVVGALPRLVEVPAVARVALEHAASFIGSLEDPNGSNNGPEIAVIVDGYFSEATVKEIGFPAWCALFVSHCAAGATSTTPAHKPPTSWAPFGARFGGVEQIRSWATYNDCLLRPNGPRTVANQGGQVVDPIPGSIFVMGRRGSGSDRATITRSGHCGFVLAVEQQQSRTVIRTIEGNVGNAVREGLRELGTVHGLVEWWRGGPYNAPA